MCRFLIVKSEEKIKPENFLKEFANLCEKSKTPDGDWQGDGWGIAFLDEKKDWQIKKSLSPIWEETENFSQIPQTKLFLVHARSAHSKYPKKIDYNQPYVKENLAFVFNGFLRQVKLPFFVEGEIGAQKIFSLILKFFKKFSLAESLKLTKEILKENSQEIENLNIGICDKEKIAVLCFYQKFPEYSTLHYGDFQNIKIICSENLKSFPLGKMENEKIEVF